MPKFTILTMLLWVQLEDSGMDFCVAVRSSVDPLVLGDLELLFPRSGFTWGRWSSVITGLKLMVATEDKRGNQTWAELANTYMKYVSICLKIQLPVTVTSAA